MHRIRTANLVEKNQPPNRTKLFLENFLAYGAINALNMAMPILMLPVLTRFLTDPADLGRFDIFNTIVSFGAAIAGLGLYDAMFREYFEREDEDYRAGVTSTALIIAFISSIVVTAALLLFRDFFSLLFLGSREEVLLILLSGIGVFMAANRGIISAPTRMQNKRKIYVVSGLLNSGTYYLLAITLVIQGFGYKSVIFANLAAGATILVFFTVLNKKHFHLKSFSKAIGRELLNIGIPIMPTFVIYWMFSSVDRIMINNILGFEEVGIYSIGAKVAAVSTFVYSAFAGGWQYFSFSTMKDKDQVEMNSKILEYLSVISFLAFFVVVIFKNLVFETLFTGEYVRGVEVFPFLFLSPLVLMFFQVVGNQFLIIKKSYIITLTLILGAFLNIVLNYVLITAYGIKGAAVATLVGYLTSFAVIFLIAWKMKLIRPKMRSFGFGGLAVAVSSLLFVGTAADVQVILVSAVGIVIIAIFYMSDIVALLRQLRNC